jgi:hypothetical protein
VVTRLRTYRTSVEVAGWRAQARADLAEYQPTPYLTASRTAASATFAWLVGETRECPASGEFRSADDIAIGRELMFAWDAGNVAGANGQREIADGLGAIYRVLAWYMLDPAAPTPF